MGKTVSVIYLVLPTAKTVLTGEQNLKEPFKTGFTPAPINLSRVAFLLFDSSF